jgi:heme A synthase
MTRVQTLHITTVAATLLLITIGAIVRTTESGLGCPDWPLCYGQIIPPAEKTAIIEWSHRTVASIVGLLVVASTLVALRQHRNDRLVFWIAIPVLPLLAIQAWLGKITVERELPPEIVAIHLSTALVLLALLSLIAAYSFLGTDRARWGDRDHDGLLRVSVLATAVTAVVLVIGSYVVGTGAGYACSDWPGCSQATIPFLDGGRLQHIHWLHRITVVIGAAVIALLAYFVLSEMRDPDPLLRKAAHSLIGLYAVQIVIGALNPLTDFSTAAQVAHLAVGSAIWALLVVTTFASQYRPETDLSRSEHRPTRGRTGASA